MLRSIRSGTRRAAWWRLLRRGEGGQALALVLVALALLATVPMVVMSTTVNQLPLTTRNLDWNGAFEAAQAGLSDYLQQLDANETYAQYSATNTDNNPAFTGWEAVASSTDPPEWYEYTPVTEGGHLVLTVSGAAGNPGAGNVIRTFQYELAPTSTMDFIYWTDCESSGDTTLPCSNDNPINFDSADTLNGPAFSNDDFFIDGSPTFDSTVESANNGYGASQTPPSKSGYSTTSSYYYETSGSAPHFDVGGAPSYHPVEYLPANGVTDDAVPAEDYGCLISTSTSSETQGGTGTVTMTLSSGTVKWSGGTLDTTDGNKGANCGSSTSGTVTLKSLKSDLFYVNGNITIAGGGTASGFLTLVSNGNIQVDGNVTYPSGDITTSNGQEYDNDDALGLIAYDDINVSDDNATTVVDAALMAITGSFQNSYASTSCNNDPCPTLTVFGSIAQDTRGVVGYLNSSGQLIEGYAKAYSYDNSFLTLWPPFFLPISSASWTPQTYSELLPGSANEAVAKSPPIP